MSRTRLVVLGILVLLLGGGILAGRLGVLDRIGEESLLSRLREGIASVFRESVEEIQFRPEADVSIPGPLRIPFRERAVVLTRAGVLQWTNTQRTRASIAVLKESSLLNTAAERKVQDMFARQYFAHVSPDGQNIGVVVQVVGYTALRVGENLALGNFSSDEALVQAWMDSPGHRANILESRFAEIGIAVAQGTFEGRKTWMAVQVFALPRSACPAVDEKLAQRIDEQKGTHDTLITEAKRIASEGNAKIEEGNREIAEGNRIYQETGDADAARPHWERGEQLQSEGRALLEEARRLQDQAESLRDEINANVDQYNAQMKAVRACAGGA